VNAEVAGDLSPLLKTKLAQPVCSTDMLARPRLVAKLADSGWRVCLISAPAGWGKTSLVASWRANESGRSQFAFLRLEERDDDSPLFWTYVIAALRTVYPTFMDGTDASLRTPGMDPMRQVVPRLINELTDIDEPTVLVLDDYHLVKSEEIHSSVAYLIEHIPPQVRLVIATRSDPPLPLSRLRASDSMIEVRSGQLGFSGSETGEFLASRFGLTLANHSTEALRHRTEGWPAGLQLAGLSLVGASQPEELIDRFAGDDRNVADYLISEVFRGVTPAQSSFLLRTSVLERMTAPLCDAVVDTSNSVAMLEELERANLFVIPLDTTRGWYRYHHLFQDWLRHELEVTDPAAIPQIHARASAWYEEHELLDDAIDHALNAGEADRAAALMERCLIDWNQVHWSQAMHWLTKIPDDVVSAHTMCALGRARSAMTRGAFGGGWDWIEAAEAAVDRAPAELQSTMRANTGLYRAAAEMVTGDLEKAREMSVEITNQERAARSSIHAVASGIAGMTTFWLVGALEAIPLLSEASVARAEHSVVDNSVTPTLAAAYAEIGDWDAAEAAISASFELPTPPDWYRFPDHMAARCAKSKVLSARGLRDEAIDQARQALAMARNWIEPLFVAYGCLALADVLTDYSEKRALVREARQTLGSARTHGRIMDLVVAAERKLALRSPSARTEGTVHVEPLTDREQDVLRLLKGDMTLREIGAELYLSHNTVKGYTQSLYRKLGVTSRASAIEASASLDL
jgi:LuxR family maltose regulon positive regulatory protein